MPNVGESTGLSFELIGGDFLLDIQDFMYARMESISMPKSSPGYAQAEADYEKRYIAIKESLSPEQQQLLIEMSELETGMKACVREVFYRHGFSDGIRFILHAMTMAQ